MNTTRRRAAVFLALGAAGSVVQAQPASAADGTGFPSKPIRILVGYPPGASTDAIARYIADMLAKSFNATVIVENKPGAGGNIASDLTRQAPADGHTLLMAIAAHVTNRGLYKTLAYDPIKDFTAVNLMARIPFVLVANPSFPGNTVADVLALAKSKPGALDYATSGIGSSQHLSVELFKRVTGAQLNHVPYKGGAPALMALVANEVPLALLSTTLVLPLLQKGSIKAIAVGGTQRSPLLPNVPTFIEAGVPNFTSDTWYGILAPANTPPAIVNRINGVISRGLASKEMQDKFASQDAYIINAGPADFAKVMRDDDVKWFQLVRQANIQPE